MSQITDKIIKSFSDNFHSSNINVITKNAISNNKLHEIIKNRNQVQQRNHIFSKHIDIKVKNTEQKNSGRCWIFAFLNIVRLEMIKKYKLTENFELSQNYLFFWDKLEKSNFFIQNIINTKNKEIHSRELQYLLTEPVSDGGQWNMLVNLVNKYGIIPKTLMNETFSSSDSEELNYILNNKLRNIAYEIRNTDHITKNRIDKYLEEIYKIIVLFLGEPPKKFFWEYYSEKDDKKKYHIIKNLSPLKFYRKYIPYDINNKVCLINAPCKTKPFYHLYDLKYCGNTVEGKNTNFVNIPIDVMIKIAKKSLDNNKAIWIGCDMDHYYDREMGILDTKYFDYQSIFDNGIIQDKGNRLDYCVSKINHAMIIKGYDSVNNKITKWLVENSWGEDNEFDGNLIMSNEWFREYLFEIVVDKKYVNQEILKAIKKKPILLEPWDPLGILLQKSNKNIKRTQKNKNKNIKYTKKK